MEFKNKICRRLSKMKVISLTESVCAKAHNDSKPFLSAMEKARNRGLF